MELTKISRLIGMEVVPKRIEVIDASHVMGRHTMVGMIVFEDGELKKDQYRIFKFSKLDHKRDDYLTLHEWTKRRFKLGEPWPDLIIIDGGKGQINAVKSGFKKLFETRLPFRLISIAKSKGRLEPDKIYIEGRKNSILLSKKFKGTFIYSVSKRQCTQVYNF